MSRLWNHALRAAYRRHPLSSFVITVGAVDVAIATAHLEWSLLVAGMAAIGTGIALRWWARGERRSLMPDGTPLRSLPERSSARALPRLDASRPRKK